MCVNIIISWIPLPGIEPHTCTHIPTHALIQFEYYSILKNLHSDTRIHIAIVLEALAQEAYKPFANEPTRKGQQTVTYIFIINP